MLYILIPLLLSVNSPVITEKNLLQETIKKVENETAKYKDYASQLVAIAENKQTSSTTVNGEKDRVIDKWLNSYEHIKKEAKSLKSKEGLYIFVSLSLPKTLLHNLDKVARKIGARLVIRGLKDNSFKNTLSFIKEINGIVIDIDPEHFKQFGINLVPAFVVNEGQKYDKIVGNISIAYVLNKFIAEGDTFALSREYLKRLSNDA